MRAIPEKVLKSIERLNETASDGNRILKTRWYKKGEHIFSIILASTSIILGVIAMRQQQQIKGFDIMLRKLDTQTITLSQQLEISQQLQKQANQNFEIKMRSEANRLLASLNSIRTTISDIRMLTNEKSEISLVPYLSLLKDYMKSQLDNNFLMSSSKMSTLWVKNEIEIDKAMTRMSQYYHRGGQLTKEQIVTQYINPLTWCTNVIETYCKDHLAKTATDTANESKK